MNRTFILILGLILVFSNSCSFDSKTGIWDGDEEEEIRIANLEKEQSKTISRTKIYSSKEIFAEEIALKSQIFLSKPKNNASWQMSGSNYQNLLGNIYLPSSENNFLKKKIGKNKFLLLNVTPTPLIFKDHVYIADDAGTIFKTTNAGKIVWKTNIYKKIHKKIYKRISFAIFENNMYISDNIGFIYSINLENGKLIWVKNHAIPLKSKIKVYKNKIFLINQDNRILSFNAKDGSLIWDLRSITSFIKSKKLLSIAFTTGGDLIASSSSGELIKIKSSTGQVYWALNSLASASISSSDFFSSSDVVLSKSNILFSTEDTIFSYDQATGLINWEKEINAPEIPIVDKNNIFFVTQRGFFVILKADTGEIVYSSDILKNLKKKRRKTNVVGFIMGSGKIYSVTANGYLIVVSASSGKLDYIKRIGDPIASSPIINDGKLYIFTEKSRIFGFN